MAFQHCDINTFLLVVFVILIIAFTDNILNNTPILKKLFTDQINFILLITLVILVILIDIPNGIVLAFLVLYLSVNINYNKKKLSFNDVKNIIPLTNASSNINNTNSSSSMPYIESNQYGSESEFIYNNTKPFPNHNLNPFSPDDKDTINLLDNSIKNTNQENTKFSINSNLINENTLLNRDGYDVTGCRYDFTNNPQNLTKFGPPLSQCSAYDVDKVKACGTVFYPLNA
jgi:hypothetical protein